MGTRVFHRGHVLVGHRAHRDGPRPSVYFLHRQPRLSWCQRRVLSRTGWIPGGCLLQGDQRYPQCYVPLEQLVSRWPFSQFHVWYCVHPPRCIIPTPSAPSLLCILLHEPLGHGLPLPHVPRICGCVPEFYTNNDDAQG